MGGITAGVVEEAAFRGYMQTGIEAHDRDSAIWVTSLVFVAAHITQGIGAVLVMGPGIFIASLLYGTLVPHGDDPPERRNPRARRPRARLLRGASEGWQPALRALTTRRGDGHAGDDRPRRRRTAHQTPPKPSAGPEAIRRARSRLSRAGPTGRAFPLVPPGATV